MKVFSAKAYERYLTGKVPQWIIAYCLKSWAIKYDGISQKELFKTKWRNYHKKDDALSRNWFVDKNCFEPYYEVKL